MSKILFTGLILLSLTWGTSHAQKESRDTTDAVISFFGTYSFHLPGGDMADRFGNSSTVGGGVTLKTRNNLLFGLEFDYLFGNEVKIRDQILNYVIHNDGLVIGGSGFYTGLPVYERGFFISGDFGKIFPLFGSNNNSGLLVSVSPGYFQHKIRIEANETPDNIVFQFDGDYKKGYDRLTSGFGLREFIGYIHYGNKRIINFFAGFEFYQAFTKSRREVYFDTKQAPDESTRLDLLNGFKVGWFIPLYFDAPDEYYYY